MNVESMAPIIVIKTPTVSTVLGPSIVLARKVLLEMVHHVKVSFGSPQPKFHSDSYGNMFEEITQISRV